MAESSTANNQLEREKLLKQPVNEVVPQRTQQMPEVRYAYGTYEYQLQIVLEAIDLPERYAEECIYKVPQRIRQINPQVYTPQIIGIGLFHNPLGDENNNLQEMEVLKLKYLKGFLERTNLSIEDLVLKLRLLEKKIRNCYAGGHVRIDGEDFLNIIITDACFIIEHFLRCFSRPKDPILLKPRLFREIERDLLLLENQLPFFVLDEIYKFCNAPAVCPFIQVTVHYFQEHNRQSLECQNIYPKHFTDLQRTFFLPTKGIEHDRDIPKIHAKLLYSASQLSEAGLKFQLRDNTCLFDMEFVNGVLHMPCFNVSDTTETYMKNLLAYEECHISDLYEKYISQYIRILDFLIDTEKDVSILVDKKIIVHGLGDANEVATMVNTLCKNISMPIFNQEFIVLIDGLNGLYENSWKKNMAILKREYFGTPWKTASTIIASLLVLFTLIQAVCSIWSLAKQK